MAVKYTTINTLEYATKLTSELDKILVAKSVTAVLEDKALAAKFVGAKTILVPNIGMQALADYDRDTGFVRGAVSVANEPFTLSMDRGRSFQVDRMDDDETGVANLQGNVTSEFVRTQVVPELDAYVLSKLAGMANVHGHTVTGTPSTQAIAMLNKAILGAREAVGDDEDLIAFVSYDFWANLDATTEVTRQITVGDFKKGEINTKVKMLNGVPLLTVPSSRMKSAFVFLDGTTDGQKDGGFRPATNAKDIGFIVMPKRAAKLVKKTEQIRNFAPNQNLNADAWKTDYRVYYDVFVMATYADSIYAYINAAGNGAYLSEATGTNAELYGKTLADLQRGIVIDEANGIITGHLKNVVNYGGGSGFDDSKGTHYLAIQLNNVPDGYTANLRMVGGNMSGGVNLIAGEDYSAVLQFYNPKEQGIIITLTKANSPTYVKSYRTDGLIMD